MIRSHQICGLILAIAFCGCTKNAPVPSRSAGAGTASKFKIGFLVKQPEEPWFQFEWKGADAAAAKHGFEVIKLGVPDGEKVIAAIDNLAALGAQGFVICAPDVRLGPAIVAQARRNNMKVIAVDDRFVGADGKFMTEVPYLGMSASKIGESVGTALADEMKRRNWPMESTGACVVTFEELDTARQRTDGHCRAQGRRLPSGPDLQNTAENDGRSGKFRGR